MKKLKLITMIILAALAVSNLTSAKYDNQTEESFNKSNFENSKTSASKFESLSILEDINADGVVDSDDIEICILEVINFCAGGACQADLNGDNFVDGTDLLILYNYICTHLSS